MPQTGYTPIQIYSSSTPTNAPSAGNLTNDTKGSELAINIADKNLFFKDSSNSVNTVPIRQSGAASDGWLSSTDWNTFNNKQPAGAYLTSVTADAPLSGAGTSASHLVIAQATTSTSGYLSSTDWNTFNGKQAALVSGSNIKTVNGTTLLGSGDLGTIAVAYGGTGSPTAGITSFNNITGYTASGATGTTSTNLVFSTSPTITTPKATTTIGVGNATPAASGAGITFPATQSASSDANTLDDYEEGTFTPTIVGDSSAGAGTYSTQAGKYTKIGNLVTFSAVLVWSAHTGTGNMRVANLPFTSISGNPEPPVALLFSEITYTGTPCGVIITGNSQIYLATSSSNASASALPIDTSGVVIVSGSYQV